MYLNPNRFEVSRYCGLLQPAPPKQAQDATREGLAHGPAEGQPKPPITGVAELACAEVRPGQLDLALVGGVDGRGYLVGDWDCRH
jgi:hypothetical protein